MELQATFRKVDAAKASGNMPEAIRLVGTLTSEQRALARPFTEDLKIVRATLEQDIAEIDAQKKAILHHSASKIAPKFSSYVASPAPASSAGKSKVALKKK